MKSFLMFKDRDFDLDKILVKREKKYSRENIPDLGLLLPWNHQELIQDLGLDILFNAMAEKDNFIYEDVKVIILNSTKDADSIYYRQNILKDCIKNEVIVRDTYKLILETIEKEKAIYGWGFLKEKPDSVLHQARNKLEMFSEMLFKLRTIVERNENDFDSEGFKRLFKMLKEELSEEYLDELNYQLNELKFKDGILVSTELGFGNKGTNYVLHKPPKDNRKWWERLLSKKLDGYTYEIHPRDEAGARALSELRNQSINLVANALAQSMDHILNFFQVLRTELAFYVGCLNLCNKLKQLKEPICFPNLFSSGKKILSFSELYDINLALSSGKKVVGNDLRADGKDLFIITGANTGGKSTLLRSLGIAQLMMQAGMFVPAEKFSAEIRDSIFTHFKREEDTAMESGKLDEELNRMSEIVDKVNSKSMVLFNESFSATNEREGSEIARQITNALIESGIKVFFVTHQYEFAHNFYERNINNAIFLRAERLKDGTRTFKIKEGEPMQTSYGEDLFNEIFLKKDDVNN
jgi:DNA mismatch repair ATPase MutS